VAGGLHCWYHERRWRSLHAFLRRSDFCLGGRSRAAVAAAHPGERCLSVCLSP
jgi:hypothetical protein